MKQNFCAVLRNEGTLVYEKQSCSDYKFIIEIFEVIQQCEKKV